MLTLKEYLKKIRGEGYRYFTTSKALKDLDISKKKLIDAIYRLKKKKEIINPVKGLYLIIPPEYQFIGCLPEEQLLPILMKYLNVEYYISMLSAAQYYGAAHQKPMKTQVIVNKRLRNIKCGHVNIMFTYKKSLNNIPIQKKVVDTGYLNISSPEATAMDLLLFPHKCVGLNNVATVLSELIEEIDPKKLIGIIKLSNQKSWVQRLAYILEQIDTMEEEHKFKIIKELEKYLSIQKLMYVPLSTGNTKKGCPRNKKWKIIENTKIESDL